jgi:hypothetical protein
MAANDVTSESTIKSVFGVVVNFKCQTQDVASGKGLLGNQLNGYTLLAKQ